MKSTASILVVGNEILNGSTLDTNSHWACQQITARGGSVRRISVVPDDLETIATELRYHIGECPALIVTFGGLGPTVDDLTAEAVAVALGVALAIDREALEIVATRYAALEHEGVVGPAETQAARDSRNKMACIPVGAKPLFNPAGAAPAILAEIAETSILCLPGVPSEAHAIVEYHEGLLERAVGAGHFGTITVRATTNDESRLAAITGELSGRFPDVYVKTRLIGNDSTTIGISLSKGGAGRDQVDAELREALASLESALAGDGLGIVEVVDEK